MENKINILLVDDHPIILKGLSNLMRMNENINISAIAKNGVEALSILSDAMIDVVITDLEMPVMNGFELIAKIEELNISSKIIVLTMHNDHYHIKKLLKLNISGILSKSAGDDELKTAIVSAIAGQTYYDPTVRATITEIGKIRDRNKIKTENIVLTKSEQLIIKYIFDGLTSKEISEKLNKSSYTIETHRKNLCVKCGVKNTAGLIKFGIMKGYIEI